MKIKISESEYHVMEIPEEVDLIQLSSISDRISAIIRMNRNLIEMDAQTEVKTTNGVTQAYPLLNQIEASVYETRKKSGRPKGGHNKTKDDYIDILSMCYNKNHSRQFKDKYLIARYGKDSAYFIGHAWNIKKRFGITDAEVKG